MTNPWRRSPLRVLEFGRERCRVGPWRGDERLGYLAPITSLSSHGVRHATDHLRREGYTGVITGAIAAGECGSYVDAGYLTHEHLHLLRHSLDRIEPMGDADIRRGGRRHKPAVLALDKAAFDEFWTLDDAGLEEARRATPVSRFRVAVVDGATAGYTICGRAGTVSYLQRLAVDPALHGRGLGRDLTVEALRWARHRRCLSMLVNTQESNTVALSLYERLGFVAQRHGLYVLKCSFAS